jgi:hypothetical protein
LDFLYVLLATAPFVALLLSAFKVNLTKTKRSRQFALPLVAVVYCIVIVFLADMVVERLAYIPFIEGLGLTKWLNHIFNTVAVMGFLIVKGIMLPIVNVVWAKPRMLFNKTSGKFYEFNERMNVWVLKEEFAQAKSLWKGFFWFAVGISSVILGLSQVFPEWIFFQTPFYPVFGVLVMGEILFFLSGKTYQEMLTTIAGEDDEHYRIANYGILRRVLRDLYEPRILFDNTADNLSGLSSFEMLDNLIESEDKLDVVIAKYFTDLKEQGHTIDPGFVRSSIDMVHGKSVLMNLPFYRDLTGYIVLPLVRRLLSFEKVLVIVGRDSAANDVQDWIHGGVASFCGTPELWKTDILTDKEATCDIGVLRFADVYNRRVLEANKDFLNQIGFVVLIEPSRIVSTGQIGLSLIIEQIVKGTQNSQNIVFCSCDRNCDGLVDTLSHILKTNLTEVYATNPTLANCSLIYWNAHGDFLHHKILPNIAHYLGIGTELSSVALRYQVSNTVWVSSERFPVLDMRWIAGQYYSIICDYIGHPQSQETLGNVFKVDANLWNLGVNANAFITIEDEFNNLFEMTRLYSTRASNQGFVNVISENYFLRDYMVDNAGFFTGDSKVIPTIVSDFARTERNTIVGIIMRMFGGEVSESDLKHTLSLAAIKYDDAYEKFRELIPKHCHIDSVDVVPFFKDEIVGDEMKMVNSRYYTIQDSNTKLADYARTLSNAYFIIEDDKDKNYYLGAMLYGQVFQKYLPGQFLTYSGKFYQVHTITPESGVVLRRAADHVKSRKSYRQRREYSLSGFTRDMAMGSSRTSRGIELYRGFCNVEVKTHGYYELASLDSLATAHMVNINGIPERKYKNKTILCLCLSGVSEAVRFTVALMFNEVFVTLFPESYHYITATINRKSSSDTNVSALLSPLQLQGFECEEAIYIIEDSEIDLGLLVSVERNITRILEIIADWLVWHKEKLEEELYEFGNSPVVDESESDDESSDDDTPVVEDVPFTADEYDEQDKKYSKSYYMLYGYGQLDTSLDFEGALSFMSAHCYDKNALEQARINADIGARIESEIDFDNPDAHFCDFCAVELSGGEYDVLADGRERCIQCAGSALKTVEQYTRLYENALRNMETFFGIRINVAIKVRLADAKKIAKLCGMRFVPSPKYTGRVLAFAKKDSDGYTIYVENGAPKIAAVANIVHELTHIWQFVNWNQKQIIAKYGVENRLLVYEGMAKWAEIQYLYFLNEISYAKRQEIYTRGRGDAYGEGFKVYCKQYPLVYGPGHNKLSPFNKEWPLELPFE